MKGGITSGVVYPLAAVELSERYTFKNVGGTSAGAIAASAVAAAEHRRQQGDPGGFEDLKKLPAWLGKNMGSLYQPSAGTKRLFAIIFAATKGRSTPRKLAGALLATLANFPLSATIGLIPGLVLGIATIDAASGFLLIWGILCSLALMAIGVAGAIAAAITLFAFTALPRNYFGILSGYAEPRPDEPPPLTTWLANLLDDLAGLEPGGPPLTFGQLWAPESEEKGREVNLEMVTTCLTQGRPFRLPDSLRDFWFDPEQLGDLFPERIVNHMVEHAREDERAGDFGRLKPMPEPEQLPVVVATRMSLSFPLLISAIPLHAIDRSLPPEAQHPEPCWFSDGGITSNFPVHFFDSPVPRWPTFAIGLRKLAGWEPDADQAKNVWVPVSNDPSGDLWWTDWEEKSEPAKLISFLATIARTMQNWVDNTQSQVQGYRDRVAQIQHTTEEGGMNLAMPPEIVKALADRGGAAGERLGTRFEQSPPQDEVLTWDNQRWIRYRSFMRLLEATLDRLRLGLVEQLPGDRPIEELSRRGPDEPPAYHWVTDAQRDYALKATTALLALIDEWPARERQFGPGAPEPAPELRVAPRI